MKSITDSPDLNKIIKLHLNTTNMEYLEAEKAFQEFIDREEFDELEDEYSGAGISKPNIEYLGDRAIFYLQIENNFSDQEFSRVALAEYRDGEEYPVPFSEDQLEGVLDGTGDVVIDDSLVSEREINYPEQTDLLP